MNTAQAKLFAWGAAGLIGAAMAGYVTLFFQDIDRISEVVSKDEMKGVLGSVEVIEQKTSNKVPYDEIERTVIRLDWTGKPDPVKTGPRIVEPPKPPPVNARPVSDLVKVLMVAHDSDTPSGFCYLTYLPASNVNPDQQKPYAGLKYVDDWLDAPLDHIRVHAVEPGGVTFAFKDETREMETLEPEKYVPESEHYVRIPNGGQAIRRAQSPSIPKRGGNLGPPKKTYSTRPNQFRIGTDDAEYISQNYSEILSREVRTRKHQDPVTGKHDGIEVRSVAEGSIANSHGVQPGDVIKSINGHPVSSVPQALQFVKSNQDQYSTWEIIVENKGQQRTVTYIEP